MTPLPSLNGLRAFEAAARHMSFSKAAEELHVTQTAISHQIRKLEEQLGIRLFVRQVRAVSLTREGQDYLPAVAAHSRICAGPPPGSPGRASGAS